MTKISSSSPAAILDWPLPDVARITLNRGPELNTMTYGMLESLDAAIDQAAKESARVLILTGAGKAFCCGAHIKYFTDSSSPLYGDPMKIRDQYVRLIIRVLRKLQDMPFATIAAINGHALGGGCELAISCDFRLMSSQARIGLTEARLGAVAAAGGIQFLSRIVGRAKALEIILLGDQLSSDEALSSGLVTAVHEPEEFDEAVLAFARRLLLCSPISVAEAKRAIYRCENAGVKEADDIALDVIAIASGGPDWREGMSAFTERRVPKYVKMEN